MNLPVARQLWVIGRLSMLPQALAFLAVFFVLAWVWAENIDLDSVIETTKSIAPAFVIVSMAAIFVVSSTVVPRQESLDTIGLRSRVAASRLVAPLLTALGIMLMAMAISHMAASDWHQGPLTAGGLNLAAATMVLNCLVSPAWASLAASTYVLVCFFSANSINWWNLLMRESGSSELFFSTASFAAASILYLLAGARPAHLYEVS